MSDRTRSSGGSQWPRLPARGAGTASVTVTTNGMPIDRAQAKALKFLVSIWGSGDVGRPCLGDRQRTWRRLLGRESAGEDRETEMKRNVERILEAHVGMGNAIVELNLDVVNETERMTEQRFDPQQRALIAQENRNRPIKQQCAAAAVTAASNLPDGQGKAAARTNPRVRKRGSGRTSKSANVTREVSRRPGATRRLTVAVL